MPVEKKHTSDFTQADTAFMKRALELAVRSRGLTSPNPMVGAVLVRDGRVIGDGYHRGPGLPHAEIDAFQAAGEGASGATLYVTLEPCCHTGRTPPCTDAVIRSGVTRVVVPTPDPNPLVTGNGIKALQAAGIRVDVGLCADEARRANEFFFVYHEQKRPFIISKWAMTLDGKIATESGHSRWITNELSRAYAHEVRAQVDAVMVGVGTVLMDNPLLTVRLESYAGRQPKRVILDGTLRIPVRANCLTSASPGAVILATSSAAPPEKVAKLRADGHEVLVFSGKGLLDLHEVMAEFHRLEIQSILCEGGSSLTGSLFQAQIVDKVIAFMAPRIVGGNNSKNPIAGWGVHHMDRALNLRDITVRQFNDNVCIEGYLHKSDWSDSQPPKRNGTGRHRSIDPAKTPQGKAEKAE